MFYCFIVGILESFSVVPSISTYTIDNVLESTSIDLTSTFNSFSTAISRASTTTVTLSPSSVSSQVGIAIAASASAAAFLVILIILILLILSISINCFLIRKRRNAATFDDPSQIKTQANVLYNTTGEQNITESSQPYYSVIPIQLPSMINNEPQYLTIARKDENTMITNSPQDYISPVNQQRNNGPHYHTLEEPPRYENDATRNEQIIDDTSQDYIPPVNVTQINNGPHYHTLEQNQEQPQYVNDVRNEQTIDEYYVPPVNATLVNNEPHYHTLEESKDEEIEMIQIAPNDNESSNNIQDTSSHDYFTLDNNNYTDM